MQPWFRTLSEEVRHRRLAVVLDADTEWSFLLVLDGDSFEEQARAWLPHVLPLDFHGEYFD